MRRGGFFSQKFVAPDEETWWARPINYAETQLLTKAIKAGYGWCLEAGWWRLQPVTEEALAAESARRKEYLEKLGLPTSPDDW
jgi:hypothetical protein